MTSLQKIWRATRGDLVQFGHASRPPRPGATATPDAEAKRRTQLERLDSNGPKHMSAEGYAQAQMLLKLAQTGPAGSSKRKKKAEKVAARTAKHTAITTGKS